MSCGTQTYFAMAFLGPSAQAGGDRRADTRQRLQHQLKGAGRQMFVGPKASGPNGAAILVAGRRAIKTRRLPQKIGAHVHLTAPQR
jgi:hypothetical protein